MASRLRGGARGAEAPAAEAGAVALCGPEPLPVASIPVTIITGFLGAGKTTLLRHVLSTEHGLKIAVIQNELSASAGLEQSTVVGPNGETFDEWVELANGCICCSVRDNLVAAIEKLMEVKGRFDYILVETTGMADPGPVAESFWLDAELESPLRLDGIVTVVDAQHLSRQLRELEACRQIGCADALLLNKIDVVEPEHLEELTAHLSHLNALAPIVRTTRSATPLDRILNLHAFDAERMRERRRAAKGAKDAGAKAGAKAGAVAGAECEPCDEPTAGMAAGGPSAPAAARWLHRDSTFGAVTVVEPVELELPAVELFFAALFWEPETLPRPAAAAEPGAAAEPPEVYRAKGVIAICGCDHMYTLQAVHATYELAEGPAWPDDEARLTRLVFIGRNLDRGVLTDGLLGCKAS